MRGSGWPSRSPAFPPKLASRQRIFLHNLRGLVAIGGLLLVAQSPHWAARTPPGALQRSLQILGELVLGVGVAANLLVIGASFGAYGARMLIAALPHAPFELAAYSLALALYLEGRNTRLAVPHAVAVASLCVAILALAAALETFVNV